MVDWKVPPKVHSMVAHWGPRLADMLVELMGTVMVGSTADQKAAAKVSVMAAKMGTTLAAMKVVLMALLRAAPMVDEMAAKMVERMATQMAVPMEKMTVGSSDTHWVAMTAKTTVEWTADLLAACWVHLKVAPTDVTMAGPLVARMVVL